MNGHDPDPITDLHLDDPPQRRATFVVRDPELARAIDDPEPSAPHVHPSFIREVSDAAATYLFAGLCFVLLAFSLGASCGAAALGYRLVSEAAE